MLGIYLLSVLLILVKVQANPSIYLVQPKQEGSYFTAPNSVIAQVPLEYQLFGIAQPLSFYEFCFTVKSNHFATIIVKETCLPASNNQLVLNQLKEDEYSLTYYLREKNGNNWQEVPLSLTSNVFTVLSYENALPKIELPAVIGDTINIISKEETKTGELVIDYIYSKTALDISNFAVCGRIIDSLRNTVKLQWTCLGPNDRRLALSNLNLGKYTIDLILTDMNIQRQGKNGFLLSTQLTKTIIVDELRNALPKLSLYNPLQEYVIDPNTGKAVIQIAFQVNGIPSALQQVGVCIQILYDDNNNQHTIGQEMLKYSCLPINNNVITLQNVDIGYYKAQMVLAKVINAKDYFPESKVEFPIIVNKPVEFIPSYQWQRLHVWHTIPSGIETHLPLGPGTFQKEARIPEPWRLQLTMPDPCKYFLRMDVKRDTSIAHILKKAADQCEQNISCFKLKVGDRYIDSSDNISNVENTNLFNVEKDLLLDGSCSTPTVQL